MLEFSYIKNSTFRYQIAQANTHTQRCMNNAWSEDIHPHHVLYFLLHFSSLVHIMDIKYLHSHHPTIHMGSFVPYSLLNF